MAGRGRAKVTSKLYVGYLPETCRKSDLMEVFQKYGEVVECDIVKNFAFVHYGTDEEAQAAVDEMDDKEFQGVKIKVEMSTSRVRQKPGMGGQNECYRCGKDGHWSRDCPNAKDDRDRRRPRAPYDPYARDPYDPYDAYYQDRYPPPPPPRYRPYGDPYERRRLPPPLDPRDPYYPDPYARPPPDYYARRSPPRDPYYDYYRRPLPAARSLPRDYPLRRLPPRGRHPLDDDRLPPRMNLSEPLPPGEDRGSGGYNGDL